MIIKFQDADKWVIFGEIDHIEHQFLEETPNVGVAISSDVLIYSPANTPAKQKKVYMSFFTKNMTEPTVVHAYSPIYLMNDNGKTIEII
jgi:hypothetical protein